MFAETPRPILPAHHDSRGTRSHIFRPRRCSMKAPMFTRATAVAALLGAALALACDSGSDINAPGNAPILRTVTKLSGDVAAHVPEFAAAIGAVDNKGVPGRHDATGGLEYLSAPGTGLRVSDNNFADINPTYATELIPFSSPRLFAPIGTNRAEFRFRIPGTDTAAVVQSFGAVVVDVDKAGSSSLQAFDKDGRLIATVPIPVRQAPDAFSLVGVQFDRPAIARVVLTLGDAPLGAGVNDVSEGGTNDVVVLDDFLYSEPQS